MQTKIKMIDNFTNRYTLSKTLRFSLLPQGKTEEWFNKEIINEDIDRADRYQKAKKIIDRVHMDFIDKVLNDASLDVDKLQEYYELSVIKDSTVKQQKNLKDLGNSFRKSIGKMFEDAKVKDLLKKDIINYIDNIECSEDEQEIIKSFKGFTTYFSGYNKNRENIYTGEEKSTAVSYRIVNQNLPKFIENIRIYNAIKNRIEDVDFNEIFSDENGSLGDVFNIEYFNNTLSQRGIDNYNAILGGHTTSTEQIQGINQRINLYRQAHKGVKLPLLKQLYKQILSDREKISFIPESFESDNEVIKSIDELYKSTCEQGLTYFDFMRDVKELVANISSYEQSGIYISNGKDITEFSNIVCDNWQAIKNLLNDKYDEDNSKLKSKAKDIEKYYDKRSKELKKVAKYNLSNLKNLTENVEIESIIEKLSNKVNELFDSVKLAYENAQSLLANDYPLEKNLKADKTAISLIKNLLDSTKEFKQIAILFMSGENELDRDISFYEKYTKSIQSIKLIDFIYDKVRNYVTQKPYSKDKIKLSFSRATLLNGWDANKEEANLSVMLIKDGKYYLGIMNRNHNKVFSKDVPEYTEGACYEKMTYRFLPTPNKMLPKIFFSKKNKDTYNTPKNIQVGYEAKKHLKSSENFDITFCHELIDYFKECINIYKQEKKLDFNFKETSEYKDISEFYKDVTAGGYKLEFKKMPATYIDNLVEEGKLYLFQIYNKDFSPKSKGTPNLHTMYFKALFEKENLENIVYKLNGESEIFYREKSVDKTAPTHFANEVLANKNPLNPKRTSTFTYDLIKDRRYTKHQFLFHMPISLNYLAEGRKDINTDVRKQLKAKQDNYVIGIDRGERHLIYVTVVNSNGDIVEQFSLNEIVNEYKGVEHRTNYHDKLVGKSADRQKERKNWEEIETIKELKEGYISQVVNKICKLVVKYDAIIAMEDLNSGFKNGRKKVEQQTYQKFEKMLIDKLNYYVDKNAKSADMGGLYNAYQLAEEFKGFNKMYAQTGIIFYVPAWLTSKIDPVTGFVDLLYPKYKSMEQSRKYISSFDKIYYSNDDKCIVFDTDYSKFSGGDASFVKKWKIHTNGERIQTYENKQTSKWETKTIDMTGEFITMFNKYGIDINGDIISQAIAIDKADFHKSFMYLLKLTLQMRNSVPNSTIDYMISPIKDENGNFYDSRRVDDKTLPENADANGAYNIARKALMLIDKFKQTDDEALKIAKLGITKKEWLEEAQS